MMDESMAEAMAGAMVTSMSWFLITFWLALVAGIGLALYDRWRR